MLENIQTYISFILIGMVPSFIWLSYYLHKDPHKEPKRIIIQVFIFGMLSSIVALFLEIIFLKFLLYTGFKCEECNDFVPDFLGAKSTGLFSLITIIVLLGLAFIEEVAKYIAVKIRIIKSFLFDEPIDAMIYLIVGALGFAALENIGYMLSDMENAISIIYYRFFTATFLHVLASAIVGYYFALSIIYKKNHFLYISYGIFIATILHAAFNFLILAIDELNFAILYLTLLIFFMYSLVSYMLKKIKKIHYNMQNQ